MGPELPLACSLGGGDLSARLAEIAAIGREALAGAEIDGRRATLRFRPGTGTRDRLAAIVAAEAQCCPFLVMRLDEDPAQVTLTVLAPAGAEPVVADLVAAFRGEVRPALSV